MATTMRPIAMELTGGMSAMVARRIVAATSRTTRWTVVPQGSAMMALAKPLLPMIHHPMALVQTAVMVVAVAAVVTE